jgi:hypothetical protein
MSKILCQGPFNSLYRAKKKKKYKEELRIVVYYKYEAMMSWSFQLRSGFMKQNLIFEGPQELKDPLEKCKNQ